MMKQNRCCSAESPAKQGTDFCSLSSVPSTLFAIMQDLIRPCAEPGCSPAALGAAHVQLRSGFGHVLSFPGQEALWILTDARTNPATVQLHCWQSSCSLCWIQLTDSTLPFIGTLINKTWNKPVCSLHLSASTKGKQLVVTVVSTPTKTSVYPRKQHHPLAVRCLASGKAVALVLQPGASPQLKGMAVTPVFCSPRAKSLFSARHRAHRDPSPNRAWQSFSTIWEFGGFLSLGMEFLYRWCFTGNH